MTPVVVTITNLQKQSVKYTPLDVNNNPAQPIAGIAYSSTDSTVAGTQVTSPDQLTIDVHGLAPGTATIRATVNPGGGQPQYTQDIATVTVTQDPSIPGRSTHLDGALNGSPVLR